MNASAMRKPLVISPLDSLRGGDPRLIDIGAALLSMALTLLAVQSSYASGLVMGYALSMALGAACSLTMLIRRRLPELAALAGIVASLVSNDTTLLIFNSWALARYGLWHRVAALTTLVAGYFLTRPLVGMSIVSSEVLYHGVSDVLIPALVGAVLRRQEQLNRIATNQIQRVRGSVDQAAQFAVLEERTRIAFDMHDGIGHSIAVVSLQAAAIKVNAGNPEKVRQGAEIVEETARTVMAELREILDMLRSHPRDGGLPSRLPEAGYASFINSLARNMTAVGVEANCSVVGTPVPLSRETQSLLYRTGQEGLTNAVKHAPGAPISIRLAFHPRHVALAIENGRPRDEGLSLGSGRAGLSGLRARVQAYGGTLDASPLPRGGFLLQANLPLSPRTADTARGSRS
ncbi:hypothetical protein H9Y04_44605 [Streptomyces sp. TRM66268-LWL]|uniref:histidine kinase n=1 Tax=Streptomyces polyasparticus TaxID=2767826 RepID=A0ABR7SZ93_9ACTN|nr:histidine kinase [Streptomyces polyasparticus]MBC9719588.1 hypothetical protein [Streptomyces polyasparticus]